MPSATHIYCQPAVLDSVDLEPAVLAECDYQSTPVRSGPSSSTTPRTPRTPRTPTLREQRIYSELVSPGTPIPVPITRTINVLIQHHIGTVRTRTPSRILDSGATVCGAGPHEILQDIVPCHNTTVQGAFGEPYQPTTQGTILGNLKLPCIRLPGNIDTLVSVSALCKRGYVVLFTEHGCSAYTTKSVSNELDVMASTGNSGRTTQRPVSYAAPAE